MRKSSRSVLVLGTVQILSACGATEVYATSSKTSSVPSGTATQPQVTTPATRTGETRQSVAAFVKENTEVAPAVDSRSNDNDGYNGTAL
jgi:ABC-type glycerol-3-phosphate transport system substrate-binding protein